MAKTPPKTTVSSEGLRYHSKVPGSPFVATGHFGAATMSCFLCGKHRPRAQLKSRKLMGKTHFVCAPSCKETIKFGSDTSSVSSLSPHSLSLETFLVTLSL